MGRSAMLVMGIILRIATGRDQTNANQITELSGIAGFYRMSPTTNTHKSTREWLGAGV